MAKSIVITIDGPAASGKSTIAKALAERLGFRYLDTGAMYRALALVAIRKGVDLSKADEVEKALADCRLALANDGGALRVSVNGEDVTADIRKPEVTGKVFHIADLPAIRSVCRKAQRDFAEKGPTVAEGRDQGTVVFPAAEIKFYLDAALEERARRRLKDLEDKGISETFEKILSDIRERDKRDLTRTIAPLRKAETAIYVDSTETSIEETVETLHRIAEKELGIRD
jgi:cytidylate kinase